MIELLIDAMNGNYSALAEAIDEIEAEEQHFASPLLDDEYQYIVCGIYECQESFDPEVLSDCIQRLELLESGNLVDYEEE